MGIRVYEWPDGSSVVLDPKGSWSRSQEFELRVGGLPRGSSIVFDGQEMQRLDVDPVEPKALLREELLKWTGFLLDLGIERPERGRRSSLVFVPEEEAPYVPYPRWIPDERWENRFREAVRYVLHHDPSQSPSEVSMATDKEKFLGHLLGFQIERRMDEETKKKLSRLLSMFDGESWVPGLEEQIDQLERQSLIRRDKLDDLAMGIGDESWPAGWVVLWSGEMEGIERDTFRGIVEAILERELLLPVSERPRWEAQHIEYGRFLVLSPEEARMYRALGEPLPLLWAPDDLIRWLEERRDSTAG